jgi:hypothetical protein
MTETLDAQQLAKDELAEAMFPAPEDFLNDVGPLAQLYYVEQLAYQVMGNFAAMLANAPGGSPEDGSEPVQALSAIAEACGNLDAACVLLSILPAEAQAPGA